MSVQNEEWLKAKTMSLGESANLPNNRSKKVEIDLKNRPEGKEIG